MSVYKMTNMISIVGILSSKVADLLHSSVFEHSSMHSLKFAAINFLITVLAPWVQHCM
jgi:hypothetical protein